MWKTFNNIIRSKVFEENIAVLFNKAHFIGLRNNGSIDEVRAFLSDDIYKKIHYQPCPTTCARLFVDRIPRKKITKKIGFNVALDRIEQRLGEDYHDILREIAIAMHLIQKRGYEIHFFVHCEWEVQFFDYIRKEGVQVKYHHITAADTYNILCQYNEMVACAMGIYNNLSRINALVVNETLTEDEVEFTKNHLKKWFDI